MDVFDELESQLDMARPLPRPRRNFPSFDYFDSFGNFNGLSGPKMASYVWILSLENPNYILNKIADFWTCLFYSW